VPLLVETATGHSARDTPLDPLERFAEGRKTGTGPPRRKGGRMYIGVGALILIILLIVFVF
jgi:hypothetical protein